MKKYIIIVLFFVVLGVVVGLSITNLSGDLCNLIPAIINPESCMNLATKGSGLVAGYFGFTGAIFGATIAVFAFIVGRFLEMQADFQKSQKQFNEEWKQLDQDFRKFK